MELLLNPGFAIIVILVLYIIIKSAVKNGIKEAYKEITTNRTKDDIQTDEIIKELDLNKE